MLCHGRTGIVDYMEYVGDALIYKECFQLLMYPMRIAIANLGVFPMWTSDPYQILQVIPF